MTTLQVALLRAGLITVDQLRTSIEEHKNKEQVMLEQCRRNVIRCNTSKKLKYCRG